MVGPGIVKSAGHEPGIDSIFAALVQCNDLSPPPNTWIPPNCTLEVEDALQTWTFSEKFDYVHLRDLQVSFTDDEWTIVFKQAY